MDKTKDKDRYVTFRDFPPRDNPKAVLEAGNSNQPAYQIVTPAGCDYDPLKTSNLVRKDDVIKVYPAKDIVDLS